ncbi:TonB-dependent receptor [Mucilaginibacter rubeus]|uniref:TonB-dependent receptor n=1 Tax=Mucilaginibacter rubeus TaxID=2027860 RepID=A0AAE6JNQ0_9SPHI|nr:MULTISPECIES: TonB-dependent receptor [Mucilaginibacter]QEM07905.1 TonB-dependent receptor [Mucilaginibacter rubeus]QEM20357.1 TonB-dependent receptor [Mucilaginibacter gossypii]QTE42923.1 TonB-dependent receptor [Mucilaginibacter rubeus]QTE49524.1 TonB-dependent receptor [Mucilaginibacter rubeus]QTE54620.1 TonB-dependent receptor [Mucilaginibacter rubeus]
MKKILLLIFFLLICGDLFAQIIHGKVFDAVTQEPIPAATIADTSGYAVTSKSNGSFNIKTNFKVLKITSIGYQTRMVTVDGSSLAIALQPPTSQLNQVVVSANRTAEKRTEAPIAIATVSSKVIQDTKAQGLDQLVNKVSGVNMVSLGNEQHAMSIRQPMNTNNLFLYLEDGLPLRTSAVFNHNALVEMNMTAAKNIEVIKGPSSALYGAEAIGGVINLITQAPPAYTSGYLSGQTSNRGYKRVDGQIGTTAGKLGFIVSGYYANQTNGPIQYSDFHKTAITSRLDYHIDSATTWTNSVSYINYYSDMYGSLDSAHFAGKIYSAQSFFTYRKVTALRARSTITHRWSENGTTNATFLFRNNSVAQNPSYSIATYRTGGKASNPVSPDTASGNINTNAFKSYGLFLQHVQRFKFLNSKLIIGTSAELDPQSFFQDFIWIKKQTQNGVTNYVSYTKLNPDSVMANYHTVISNFGSYVNYDFTIAPGLRISAALRYDAFQYAFVNSLPGSKVTGGPSAITNYGKLAPKIGFTYNYHGIGFYGTYSEGYVPPQITDVFGKTTNNAYLLPQTFKNYELGGWLSLVQNKLYVDYSFYLMNGTNEIINVRLPDNTTAPQNAGATRHQGVEYGISYRPTDELYLRLSGTNALHKFVNYVASGVTYNGYEMPDAPHFIGNAEIMYKPHYLKGFRIGAEEQIMGKYFEDNQQLRTYNGFKVSNIRAGYEIGPAEIWVNALNVFNTYYATLATATVTGGKASYSYNLGDPRAFTLGLAWHFGKH